MAQDKQAAKYDDDGQQNNHDMVEGKGRISICSSSSSSSGKVSA